MFACGILQFLQKNSDPAAVQKETVELINYVDGVGLFSHLCSVPFICLSFQKRK